MVTEDIPSTPSPADSGPIGAEIIFPTEAIPLVIAGIPESLLPICGPEAQSCYRCQFTDCTQIFLQKSSTLYPCSLQPSECGLSLFILQW